jgi:hypothetical protein
VIGNRQPDRALVVLRKRFTQLCDRGDDNMSSKPKLVEPKTAEDKATKFSRQASLRVTRAVRAINRGGLSSPQYERSAAQIAKIETHLTNAVQAAVERLRGPARADAEIEI